MEDGCNGSKRLRSFSDEESPEAKRFHADILLDILEDDDDAESEDSAVEELAGVMQSLEDEISLPQFVPAEIAPNPVEPEPEPEPESFIDGFQPPDLGYLLEASDDELGLPPTVPSPAGDFGSETENLGSGGEAEAEAVSYDQIWGFGDEIQPSFYDFEARPEAGDGDVIFNDGLFEYDDVFPSDFSDANWRTESLPAI